MAIKMVFILKWTLYNFINSQSFVMLYLFQESQK